VAVGFKGTVRRTYALEGNRVLILEEGYEGDIEVGELVEVAWDGASSKGAVVSVAWGSAFRAEDPPLTLVVSGLEGEPPKGANVSGVSA
jgi:hypothetical protein